MKKVLIQPFILLLLTVMAISCGDDDGDNSTPET